MEKGLIKFLEEELKLIYMNDVLTWSQVEKAIKKYFETEVPNPVDFKKCFDEGIVNYYPTKYLLAHTMFFEGMKHELKKIKGE